MCVIHCIYIIVSPLACHAQLCECSSGPPCFLTLTIFQQVFIFLAVYAVSSTNGGGTLLKVGGQGPVSVLGRMKL